MPSANRVTIEIVSFRQIEVPDWAIFLLSALTRFGQRSDAMQKQLRSEICKPTSEEQAVAFNFRLRLWEKGRRHLTSTCDLQKPGRRIGKPDEICVMLWIFCRQYTIFPLPLPCFLYCCCIRKHYYVTRHLFHTRTGDRHTTFPVHEKL